MISPEVFNFSPPPTLQQTCIREKSDVKEAVQSGRYGSHFHAISVVVPGRKLDDELKELLNNSVYYKVTNLPIHHFLEPSFMLSFARKGTLNARTLHTWPDVDTSATFHSGKLVISVGKDVYQELGLNGQPCLTLGREVASYAITLDFHQDSLLPGSKYHQRAKWCLEKNPDLTFDWIISWEPDGEEICVSSVAAYLDSKGFEVSQCKQRYEEWEEENIKMPLCHNEMETTCLVEWVGIAGLHMKCIKEGAELSTYSTKWTCPEPSVLTDKTTCYSWKGYLAPKEATWILEELLSLPTMQPWANITLHGFENSPLGMEDVTSIFILENKCKIFTARTPKSTKIK